MAAAPDDDARRTLAELEAKLRELERELLRGYEPEGIEADPFAAPDEPAVERAPEAAASPAPLEAVEAVEPAAPTQPAAPPEPAASPEPAAFPSAAAPPEPEASPAEPAAPPEPAAFPSAAAPPEPEASPAAFDPGEWATPESREYAPSESPGEPAPSSLEADVESVREPQAAGEPAATYDGGLAREPLPDYESIEADRAAPPYPAIPQPEPPARAPEPEPEPVARLDHDALDTAHGMLADLRETIEDMGLTAARVSSEAKAVADDHGRALGRMARAAQAAARAEEAAHEAGRLASTVVVEAGPFADAGAVTALRDALAAQPGARDAYVRGVEGGRAVIEVHLDPPSA